MGFYCALAVEGWSYHCDMCDSLYPVYSSGKSYVKRCNVVVLNFAGYVRNFVDYCYVKS